MTDHTTAQAPAQETPPSDLLRIYAPHIPGYMHRWLIETPWFTLRLHKILASDQDEELHDHPWAFCSLLLRGAYQEVEPGPYGRDLHAGVSWDRTRRIFRAPAINFRPDATAPHRLEVVDGPIWTLVVTGPRVRPWGFWTRAGWVPWRLFETRKIGAPTGAP